LWSYGSVDGCTLGGIFCLCGRIIGVGDLEACPVFEPSPCSGGVLKFSVCEVGRDGLLVFGSVQVGEGSFCLCL